MLKNKSDVKNENLVNKHRFMDAVRWIIANKSIDTSKSLVKHWKIKEKRNQEASLRDFVDVT